MRFWIVCSLVFIEPLIAFSHDAWVETNSSIVRTGDVIHIDLKLGNHGNDHRDFKLAGKVSLDPCQIAIIGPGGTSFDLKPHLVDIGFTPKEGYLTSRFRTTEPGLHLVASTTDSRHGKTKSIKSAKTYFLVSRKLDTPTLVTDGFERPLGHTLEIVPLSNPVTAMGPGQPIRVKVLLQSKPLKDARVSFVPRGTVLDEGFDNQFERKTDIEGVASYTPREGNIVLIVVHHAAPDQKGDGYDGTSYAATMTVAVPQISPDSLSH